ncbi:MAG: ABC transporter permease [Chloroflexi bacterium]|nr:ABC transporter permease [Chloroflexota bacterium]
MQTESRARAFRLPFSIRLEPRMETPRWLPYATSLGSFIGALIIGGIILAFVGGDPLNAYAHIFSAAFGNTGVLSDTLVKASPLILTGLACLIAFRARLWNIGAEGQFYLGAFGATYIVQQVFGKDVSPWIFIPTMAIAGIVMGAAIGLIPGYLKAKFGVNEIITTLMLNYIAFFWNAYWIYGSWSDRGFQLTPTFPANAWLPRLSDYAAQIPAFAGLTIHLGLVFGLLATVAVWYLLARTRWGYEIRLIGDNPNAARYAGIDIVRNTVLVMMISGALAGLAGMAEVTGVVHRLQDRISPGYGFTAIIVAWLAKLNPWAVIPVAILFGGLLIGSREIQPSGLARMLQGIILFMLISSEILNRYRIKIERKK